MRAGCETLEVARWEVGKSEPGDAGAGAMGRGSRSLHDGGGGGVDDGTVVGMGLGRGW